MHHLDLGDEAPDFDLAAAGGQTVQLSALRGSIVILFFYPKDDTEACTIEASDFTVLKPQFDQIGAVLIGLSPDSVRKHDNFRKKHGLTVTLVSDVQTTTLQRYGVWAEKTMYGRKYMGVVRSTLLIDRSGRIAGKWSNVKVSGHAAEVLEAARAIA
jgi:peroxiredoxin Q/BCP